MRQLEVTILGQVYMLGCPDGGEALLRSAAAAVDREMSAIRDAGKVKARERIAVLAALNLAYHIAEQTRDAAAPAALPAAAVPPADAAVALDALLHRVHAALADDGQLL